ncbi:MAG: hypothetical protein H7Z76_11905 [Methylotenera sp.]|nr:hypothetical protein [Flavobacterium sp.]
MLQEFLNAQLLPIDNEEYFGKLQKVADTLAKTLQKNKAKVLTYTLTALDPEVSVDNPDIAEVKELVIKKWNTFATNSKDSPTTFIRAIMLEALKIVSSETSSSCLIWLASRNIYKHFRLVGKEEEIISAFLQQLGQQNENNAFLNWSLPTETKSENLSVVLKSITGATVDKAELYNSLVAAAIYSAWGEGGLNPQAPQNGAQWGTFFADKTSDAIVKLINSAFKIEAKEINSNQQLLQDSFNRLLTQTQSEIFQKNSFLQIRTQLLWWKEACYSTSLKQSYRNQPNGLLQVILAADYNTLLPYNYPKSVDFFLRETQHLLSKDDDKKIKIGDVLKQIQTSSDILKLIFQEPNVEGGRISLLNFVKGLVWKKYTLEEFKACIGIMENTDTTLSDFTLWLLHDFQSLKIINSK